MCVTTWNPPQKKQLNNFNDFFASYAKSSNKRSKYLFKNGPFTAIRITKQHLINFKKKILITCYLLLLQVYCSLCHVRVLRVLTVSWA